jgi:hypothetical protein
MGAGASKEKGGTSPHPRGLGGSGGSGGGGLGGGGGGSTGSGSGGDHASQTSGVFSAAFSDRRALLKALFLAHARGSPPVVDELDAAAILAALGLELGGDALAAAIASLFMAGRRRAVTFDEFEGWWFQDLPLSSAECAGARAPYVYCSSRLVFFLCCPWVCWIASVHTLMGFDLVEFFFFFFLLL